LNLEGKAHVGLYVFAQRYSVIFDTFHRYLQTYSSGGATSCGPPWEAVLTCDLITLTCDLSTSK